MLPLVRDTRLAAFLPATGVVLACVLISFDEALTLQLSFVRSAVAEGQWWRLFSAQLTHWSALHLALDMAALATLCALAGRYQPRFIWLPLTAFGCALVLWFLMPGISLYRGSSPLIWVFLPGALYRLAQRPASGKILAALLACAVALTLALDIAGLATSAGLPEGVRSTWELHLVGLAAGCLSLASNRRGRAQRILSSSPSS